MSAENQPVKNSLNFHHPSDGVEFSRFQLR